MDTRHGQQIDSFLYATNGAELTYSDWHKGEITVDHHGLTHPHYIFLHQGSEISRLRWRRTRLGLYEAKDLKLDIQVGKMARVIYAKDEYSRISTLYIRFPVNPRKARMEIQLADSDTFLVHQKRDKFSASDFSLEITKEFYVSSLAHFDFSLEGSKASKSRSRTIARINIPPLMKWEAHHFHHLLALVTSCISFVQEHDLSGQHRSNFSHGKTLGKR